MSTSTTPFTIVKKDHPDLSNDPRRRSPLHKCKPLDGEGAGTVYEGARRGTVGFCRCGEFVVEWEK